MRSRWRRATAAVCALVGLDAAADAGGANDTLGRLIGLLQGDTATVTWLLLGGLVVVFLLAIGFVLRGRRIDALRRRLEIADAGQDGVLANLPDPVWFKDGNGIYLACNPAFRGLVDDPQGEVIGRTDFELFGIGHARDTRRRDQAAIERGGANDSEEWVKFTTDGYTALMLTTRVPVYGDDGELIGVLGISRDITDQRRTEDELRRRESYQRALLDNFPFLVWLKDAESRYLAVNRQFAATAGYQDPSELIGSDDFDILPPERAKAARASDRQVMTARSSREMQEEIADRDGIHWLETYRAPVLDERGKLLGTIGYARDVSDRKTMEMALRKSEARFRAFFENNSSVMLLIEPDGGTIVSANTAAASFYRYTVSELTGKSIDNINVSARAEIAAARKSVLRGDNQRFEFRHRLGNGDVRDVEVYSTPLESSGRTLLFSIVHDITERRRAEATLNRERDLFSTGPVVVFTWSPQVGWPVQLVSGNVTDVLGYAVDELTDPRFLFVSILHPDDVESVKAKVADAVRTGSAQFELSFRLRHENGRYVWFHDFARVDRDDAGHVVSVRGYLFDQSELKSLELSLADQRNRLNNVIQGMGAGTWEWNVQTGETRFNERWAEIVGYTLAELGPVSINTWSALVHPEDLAQSSELLQAHFRGESPQYQCLARMRHKDGHWVWVLDSGRVFEWADDGRPLWMYGTHQDVTANQYAEQALIESEQRLRTAGSLAFDLIYEWDTGTGGMQWFGDIDAVLGYGEEKIARTIYAWHALIHPDDRERQRRAVARLLDKGETYSVEYRVRHRDGSYRYWLDKGAPLYDAQGLAHKWVGVCTDISASHQAQERERLASTVFGRAQEGIMITDAEARIIEVNASFTSITGYGFDEVRGKNPRVLKSGRHDRAFYSAMWRHLKSDGYWFGEVWNHRKNGDAYLEQLAISCVRDDHGEVQNYVAMFSDITRQKVADDARIPAHYRDALSGLPNQTLLIDRLAQAMSLATRYRHELVLIRIALEDLGSLAIAAGQTAVEQVVIEIGARLGRAVRGDDTVARLADDQFAVLLAQVGDVTKALQFVPRLLSAVTTPVSAEGAVSYSVSCRLGIAVFNHASPADPSLLLEQTAMALRQAGPGMRYHLYRATATAARANDNTASGMVRK